MALKVVSLEDELSDELKVRLLREGKACAQLTHPNIITVYDLGEDHGRFFIVMELLQGQDLKRVIAAHATLSLADKLSFMVQVCDGLNHAHQKGIVHRDIKPGNIFVLPDRHIKLLDFGLAHVATGESSLTQTGQLVGTLAYMAPERFRAAGDQRADVFAVGAVGYELMAGRRAFIGDSAGQLIEMIRTTEPPSLTSLDASLPPELAAAIESALRKEPSARPALAMLRATFDRVGARLVPSTDASTRVALVGPSGNAESINDVPGSSPPSLPPLPDARPPRTATLVGRFGAHFRRFRFGISVTFTVTAAVLLYLVNSADYHVSVPTSHPSTSTVASPSIPPVEGPAAPAPPAPQPSLPKPPAVKDNAPGQALPSKPKPGPEKASRTSPTPQPSAAETGRPEQALPSQDRSAPPPSSGAERERGQAERRLEEATAHQRVASLQMEAEASRKGMLTRLDQAVKEEADRLAKGGFDAAQAMQAEAEALASRQSFTAAIQAYKDAAEGYRDAAERAQVVREARTRADSARARMLAEKQRALQAAPQFASAQAEERLAIDLYGRLAYKEAADRFRFAETLYASAADAKRPQRLLQPRPAPPPPGF